MAQSGHLIDASQCPLLGVKRTVGFWFGDGLSANDPNRTSLFADVTSAFQVLNEHEQVRAVTHEGAESVHPHFLMRSQRWCIICPHECHGRAVTHMPLQYVEQRCGEPISRLGFGHTNHAINVGQSSDRALVCQIVLLLFSRLSSCWCFSAYSFTCHT